MKILGFNFTKINVEKKNNLSKDVKITSGINISSIEEAKSDILNTKDIILSVNWRFEVSYNPNLALISFEGNLLIALEPKKAKDILSKWKNTKLDDEFNIAVLNMILKKSNIKAIQFEEELGLPIHFKLPSLKSKS